MPLRAGVDNHAMRKLAAWFVVALVLAAAGAAPPAPAFGSDEAIIDPHRAVDPKYLVVESARPQRVPIFEEARRVLFQTLVRAPARLDSLSGNARSVVMATLS